MSEQHESGNNLEMKFCDLSLILWEQVSYVQRFSITDLVWLDDLTWFDLIWFINFLGMYSTYTYNKYQYDSVWIL